MRTEDLNALLDEELENCFGDDDETGSSRKDNWDTYYGKPYGNEVKGRSQVVTRDGLEVVEWVKPSLMTIFTSGDTIVQFDPVGVEDEALAQQETDYTNHVFMKENKGFLVLQTWFSDALIAKNGYVKAWWDESTKVSTETYKNISEMEFQFLSEQENYELVEVEEYHYMDDGKMEGSGRPHGRETFYNCKFNLTEKTGRVRVIPVPVEEMFVSKDCYSVDVQDAHFVCHRTKKTRSDLISMGFSPKLVDSLPSNQRVESQDELARNFLDDWSLDQSVKPEYDYEECYYYVDWDDDGIDELRMISRVGNEILINETIDCIPFHSLCPNPIPHRHVGMSEIDLVADIQKIKSTLLRQILDNLYKQNNGRLFFDQTRVNMQDVLSTKINQGVRVVGGVSDAVMPEPVTPFTGHAFGMFEYLDNLKEGWSGVTRYNQGLDANALNKTATGISKIMNAAVQRIEMIARIFAETGVKSLFLHIHSLLLKNQDKAKVIKLRNTWNEVRPTEWKDRTDLTINVGLGTGDKTQLTQSLMNIYTLQKEMLPMGLVTPQRLFATMSKVVEAAGLKSGDMFFLNPSSPEYAQIMSQPKQPDPSMLALQIEAQKVQGQNQKNMADYQLAQYKLQMDMMEKQRQIELQMVSKQTDSQIKQDEINKNYDARLKDINSKIVIEEARIQADLGKAGAQLNDNKEARSAELNKEDVMSLVNQIAQILEGYKKDVFDTINSPKTIEYDDKDNVVSINGRPIQRDNRGRITGA